MSSIMRAYKEPLIIEMCDKENKRRGLVHNYTQDGS